MTDPATPPQRPSSKPIESAKKAELQAVFRLRDAKQLPITNEELFRHVGIARRTGYRILKDYARGVYDNPPPDETRGRPKALTDAQVSQIIAFLRSEGWEARTLPWKALCDAAGLNLPEPQPSPWTIRKHLQLRGWKKCPVCRRYWVDYDTAALREAFAREALGNHGPDFSYWSRIRYSDEIHFTYNPEGKVSLLRQSGERYNPDCIQFPQRPAETKDRQVCLSAWAAIGWNFKSQLVWYTVDNSNGAITLQAYRDQILEPVVKRWIDEGHDFMLEEDGASGHGGNSANNIVVQWKWENGLKYFFNCLAPPDLAPIENSWRTSKGHLKRHSIWDDRALKETAEESWAKLPQETINKWIESVPGRLANGM
ncbi:hypothetical protein F5Y03DRAFT_158484 [Xylaria venustula]|nr:hypothetical protein F5Y03DRAFT_158484 [Xylaria venustula]